MRGNTPLLSRCLWPRTDWLSNRTVRLLVFKSRAASRPDLDVQYSATDKVITAGAFPISRRRAPLSNSLVERSTKQLATERHFPPPWTVEEMDACFNMPGRA